MSARRPLLTALGATTLLAVLWFVPSANATAPGSTAPESATSGSTGSGSTGSGSEAPASGNTAGPGAVTTLVDAPQDATAQTAGQVPLGLADTGGVDTTPYLLGGTLCLGLGAGSVTFSVRRSRA
ncbi:hypothetical protein [Streptomyces sp. NPDC097981]|uniref:hypothetical protein n=1 Tax=Streptomyces sp. NPDC097981 TaxID=3155428 RepID=UPI00331E5499